MLLVPKGQLRGRDGRGPYDAGDVTAMQAVIDRTRAIQGATDLMVDYDHQVVFGAVEGVGGTAKAAGWITDYRVTDAGIEGLVEWTEAAQAAIRAREYRYISPVYRHDKAGKILSLHSIGLVNAPNFDLEAVAASASIAPEGESMLKEIAKALGLAETATEAEILLAVNAAKAKRDEIAKAAGLEAGADAAAIVTAVQGARTTAPAQPDPTKFVPIEMVSAMQTQLTTLQTSIAADKATADVEAAIKAGKLTPAMRDWGLSVHAADPAKFAAFVEKAPVLTAPQLGTGAPPKAQDFVAGDSDLAVMRQMGIDPSAFAETAKALAEGAR